MPHPLLKLLPTCLLPMGLSSGSCMPLAFSGHSLALCSLGSPHPQFWKTLGVFSLCREPTNFKFPQNRDHSGFDKPITQRSIWKEVSTS